MCFFQLYLEFGKKLGYNYDYIYYLLERDDIPDITGNNNCPKHSGYQNLTNMKYQRIRRVGHILSKLHLKIKKNLDKTMTTSTFMRPV